MEIRKGYRYKLKTNGENNRKLNQYCGNARYVYNRALQEAEQEKESTGLPWSYNRSASKLVSWKAEKSFLNLSPSQTLQQSLRDLDRAFKNFARGQTEFPVLHKRGSRDSIRFPQGFKLDEANARVFLPKLGWIRYRKSREILGEVKHVTVSRGGEHWYVSFNTIQVVNDPEPFCERPIGIDRGIAVFAATSEGELIESRREAILKAEKRLRIAQQDYSRKQKGSRNQRKARTKVARCHQLIRHLRQDFLHQISTAIAKSHGIVAIEDLKIKNMSKSAKGTVEKPGRRVKQKAGLNRAILREGWGSFATMLEYKLAERGGILLKVPPQNTSRTCPVCGHVAAENRVKQDTFRCTNCGHAAHADINAAINILNKGLVVRGGPPRSACEVSLNRGQQQEPAEEPGFYAS